MFLKIIALNLFIWKCCICEYEEYYFTTTRYSDKSVKCITNSSYALVWNTPLNNNQYATINYKSEFIPNTDSSFDCTIEDNNNCNQYWLRDNWKIRNSLDDYNNNFILDRRWEDLILYTTEHAYDFIYMKTIVIDNDNFNIPISIRINIDAHIFLCDNDYPPNANCYWFLLGAFTGNNSAIRKCSAHFIPQKVGSYPPEPCKNILAFLNHTESQPLFDESKWNHFSIKKQNNNIGVSFYEKGDVSLEYIDDSRSIRVKYLIIHSKNGRGLWKIHKYDYIYTTETYDGQLGPLYTVHDRTFCISMFISGCTDCRIEISVEDNQNVIYSKNIYKIQGSQWREIKIYADNIDSTHVVLFVSLKLDQANDKPYWAIDSIKQCQRDGYRSITLQGADPNANCQLMSSYQKGISIHQETSKSASNCPFDTIGENCVPCHWIYSNSCAQITICERNDENQINCYCSSGYLGLQCYHSCLRGFYGHGCKNLCGKCNRRSTCNSEDGICVTGGCEEDYAGEKCDIPPGLYFVHPPQITNISFTSCLFTLTNIQVNSVEIPFQYRIEYKTPRSNMWIIFHQYEIGTMQTVVNNLDVDTEYEIRAVIIDGDRINDGLSVKYTTFKTICNDIREEEISTSSTNTSVSFIFQLQREHCRLESYLYSFGIYQNSFKELSTVIDNNRLQFNDLQPYRNYTLNIKNKYQHRTISKEILTLQGRAGQPSFVRQNGYFSSKIELTWMPPTEENGIIAYYDIEYKHKKFISCHEYEEEPEMKGTTRTSNTFVTLRNLIPYSEYDIQISAFTIVWGDIFQGIYRTDVSDKIADKDIPKFEIKPDIYYIDLLFHKVGCEHFFGSINVIAEALCNDDWCNGVNKKIDFIFENRDIRNCYFPELYPFTKYTVNIAMYRKDPKIYQKLFSMEVETKPTVPRRIDSLTVYSKNNHSISLRLKRPYPPTGLLKKYFVEFRDPSNRKTTKLDFNINRCHIWHEYDCIELKKLKYNRRYTINVYAENENVTGFSLSSQVSDVTKIEAPEPPYDLKDIWLKNNVLNLTWKHPNATNGDLKYFEILISKDKQPIFERQYSLRKDQMNFTYAYTINTNLEPLSNFDIQVRSVNDYPSVYEKINIITPPPVPSLSESPLLTTVSDTVINIKVPQPNRFGKMKVDSLEMYVFVFDDTLGTEEIPPVVKIVEGQFGINLTKYRLVYQNNIIDQMSDFNFRIGNDTLQPGKRWRNPPLKPDVDYNVTIILVNIFQRKFAANVYHLQISTNNTNNEQGNFVLFSLLTLLIILPIIIAVLVVLHRQKKMNLTFLNHFSHQQRAPSINQSEDEISLTATVQPSKDATTRPTIKKELVLPKKTTHSCPIKITEFEQYVKEAIASGELERQHSLFPRGQTKPWDYGASKVNKSKNRYNNLIAYDHSRVVLKKIDDAPHSDYINANYIDSYRIPKGYIATQGPKKSTLIDFWRMIWQENVYYIVMLANVIENEKKKVEQYWPNINEELQFDKIIVQYISNEVYADYEYRIFNVTNGKQTRKVEQLHFTTWPDHGVPLYPQSLVPFLHKMLKIPLASGSPVVVHCSAGVGRTGTVIICDISLRMAAREGVVDVLQNLERLRDQRANMVDNIEQYKLTHLVVLECLVGMHTGIPCNEIEQSVRKIIENDLIPLQMRYLQDIVWQDEAMKTFGDSSDSVPIINEKNRFVDIIPEIQGRVFLPLYPRSDETSSYINAVQVDGFRSPGRFLVTQQPLPNTVGDFWRLVENKEVSVIVSLNSINQLDKSSCEFWPDRNKAEMIPVDYITLKYSNTKYAESYNVTTVQMYLNGNTDYKLIEVVALKNWQSNEYLPRSIEEFLSFWEECDGLCRKSQPVLITCLDGVKASGIFVAMSFLIEKIKLEQMCDVCQAVRTVRHNRKEFIGEKEQFKFLYEAAMIYINGFQPYANFN